MYCIGLYCIARILLVLCNCLSSTRHHYQYLSTGGFNGQIYYNYFLPNKSRFQYLYLCILFQTSRSTADTLQQHAMTGSRFSLAKQDSSDTLMVPGQRGRGYLFISPLSSRSSRSSGSVSDFDGAR